MGPLGSCSPAFTTSEHARARLRRRCRWRTGPNGFNRQFYRTLSTPVDRYLFAERSHFDITDNISFITEATYAKIAREH